MSAISGSDRTAFRDLVKRYLEVAKSPGMDARRQKWRDLHDLKPGEPPVYVRGGRLWGEVLRDDMFRCTDPRIRRYEHDMVLSLWRSELDDETVFEPWLTVRPTFREHGWGVTPQVIESPNGTGWITTHPVEDLGDLSALRAPVHDIDESATREEFSLMLDLAGDLITFDLDRTPHLTIWEGDIATTLGHLRGIEQFMLDMCIDPDGLHRLVGILRDGVLAAHDRAADLGDWGLTSHYNQAMAYGAGLQDPTPNTRGVPRSDLWCYMAAQEFALVSPDMHEEFLLNCQLPILEKFGMVAYGCCENLTGKIDMLRKIPNLRRISVAPSADVASCCAQIGTDYVMSYRPNPAEMLCCGFDEAHIRKVLRRDLAHLAGHCFDITLKDADTCQGEPDRLRRWARIVREEVAEACVGAVA